MPTSSRGRFVNNQRRTKGKPQSITECGKVKRIPRFTNKFYQIRSEYVNNSFWDGQTGVMRIFPGEEGKGNDTQQYGTGLIW
jgi:hypothetical protein